MEIETGATDHQTDGADLKDTSPRVEPTGENSKVTEAVSGAMGLIARIASDYGISEDTLLDGIQARRSSGVTDLRAARRAQRRDRNRGHEKGLLDPRLSVE